MEVPKRKIGEPGVYREMIDVLYPGEMARITISLSNEGAPETVYLVEPAPGLGAWWRRLRWRAWGQRHNSPAQLRIAYGDSWGDHIQREDEDG